MMALCGGEDSGRVGWAFDGHTSIVGYWPEKKKVTDRGDRPSSENDVKSGVRCGFAALYVLG